MVNAQPSILLKVCDNQIIIDYSGVSQIYWICTNYF
jgi:hypothetical protein